MKINLNKKILDKNAECAVKNKAFFEENNILCVNVISSPGSGKTTTIARTITDLAGKLAIGVVEGDIKTDIDARKIQATGASAVQIETEGACHLSAEQVTKALGALPTAELDVIFVENVGNLVCPSSFDLGERSRVVILSVPEGDDKPLKYPGTFAKADVVLINKIDLLDLVDFDIDRTLGDLRALNSEAKIFQVSAKTGDGLDSWYEWLCNMNREQREN